MISLPSIEFETLNNRYTNLDTYLAVFKRNLLEAILRESPNQSDADFIVVNPALGKIVLSGRLYDEFEKSDEEDEVAEAASETGNLCIELYRTNDGNRVYIDKDTLLIVLK